VGIPRVLNLWSTHQFWIGFLGALGIEARRIAFSSDSSEEQARLRGAFALLHQIAEIPPVKTGDALMGIAQLQLVQNVMTNPLGSAGGERCDGMIGKVRPQPAQLPVLWPEFVAPFRNTMRFINSKEGNRDPLQPGDGVATRQALRRKIEQSVFAL